MDMFRLISGLILFVFGIGLTIYVYPSLMGIFIGVALILLGIFLLANLGDEDLIEKIDFGEKTKNKKPVKHRK